MSLGWVEVVFSSDGGWGEKEEVVFSSRVIRVGGEEKEVVFSSVQQCH